MLQLCAIAQDSFTFGSALSVLYSVFEAAACETQDQKTHTHPSFLHAKLPMWRSFCEIGASAWWCICCMCNSKTTGQGCEYHLCSPLDCLDMEPCIHQCTLTVRSFDRSLAPAQTSSQASQDLAGLQAFAATGEDHMRR